MLSLGRKKERKKEDGQLKLISALPPPPNSLTSPATSLDFLSSIPSFFWKTLLHAIQEYIHVNGTARFVWRSKSCFISNSDSLRKKPWTRNSPLKRALQNIGLIACPMH